MTSPPNAPPTPDTLDPGERQAALNIARKLAELGVGIFVAPPAKNEIGFALPTNWQQTEADPAVVDRWQPGYALCAVMGSGIDLLDVDPRHGGDASFASMNGTCPTPYAIASTPSGGWHYFIKSLGTRSRNGLYAGIDVKAGQADGSGRGFAFLSPTEKPSKVDGVSHPYRWHQPPDAEQLAALLRGEIQDTTGLALAGKIVSLLTATPRARQRDTTPGRLGEWAREKAPQRFDVAERAIHKELAAIRDWDSASGSGGRQVVLRAAWTIGGYVGSGYLDEAEAQERLEEACAEQWGAPDADDRRWIEQGLREGQNAPFAVYTAEQEQEWDAQQRAYEDAHQADLARAAYAAQNGAQLYTQPLWTPGGGQVPTYAQNGAQAPAQPVAQVGTDGLAPPPFRLSRYLGSEPFDPDQDGTDQGLAEATAARMYPVLRYAADSGLWVLRDAERWIERKSLESWAVSKVAELMPLGDSPVPASKSDWTPEHWRAHRRTLFRSSAGGGRISQKLKSVVSGGNHPASVEIAKLDTEPEILWAGGMPWDLAQSGEAPMLAGYIDPNTPHLHTAWCAPQLVETPAWDAFLAAVFPDPLVRAWALRVLSVGLTGEPAPELPILCGPERSGKSSVLSLLVKLLGSYGIPANPKLLNANDSSHDAIIYQLKGARLAFIDEGPKAGFNATERLKQLTGGAQLTAAQKGANPITFAPTHTLAMTSNEPPPLNDPALKARLRIITCEAPEEIVKPTRERLADRAVWAAEAPGILAKMMAEGAAWLADRASASSAAAPESLRISISEMEAEQNPVTEWVETNTVPAEPGTPGRDLYRAYFAWHRAQLHLEKVSMPSDVLFGRKLSKLGYPRKNVRVGEQVIKYRSLSVRGGGGYGPPIPPPAPAQASVAASAPNVPATDRLPKPATEENASSPLVSSSSVADVAGMGGNSTEITHTTPLECIESTPDTGIGTSAGNRLQTVENPPAHLGDSGVTGTSAQPATNRQQAQEPAKPVQLAHFGYPLVSELPADYTPLANITSYQVTVWAGAREIDKTEARAELKAIKAAHKLAEKRAALAARIASASGPEFALPVAVTRELDILAATLEQVDQILTQCLVRSGGELTVDMENTGYPVGHVCYGLRTVQLGDEVATVVLDIDDPLSAQLAARWLTAAPVLVAHSGQADLVACAYAGLGDFEAMMGKLKDTAVWARLSDPKITGNEPDLKKVSPAILGAYAVTPVTEPARKALFDAGGWLTETEHDTPIERSGWAQSSKTGATMIAYAGGDVLDTAAISKRIPPLPEWLTNREREFARMTSRITYRGVPLDRERIRELEARHAPERDRLRAEIAAFPGTAIDNPGSSKQLVEAFQGALGVRLPLTKPNRAGKGGGNPSAAEDVMITLRREHPGTAVGALAELVLDYRKHNTALNTFIGPYRTICEHGDGRVRPTVYSVGTNTGRTSCVRPNAQQLPRQGGFRAMYGADLGFVIIRADFASVEIRGAGALSGDQTLLESIRLSDELGKAAKADLHWLVARQAYGPEATKEDRYRVKPGVFTKMYGGGVGTIAEQLSITESEAAVIADSLVSITPGYQRWSQNLINEVRAGRTAFEAYSGRLIWIPQPRLAPNYAVQGSCRELLVDATVDRWRTTRFGACTILPVHDELLAWVRAEDAHEATRVLVECMTSSLTGPSGATVPIKAEPDDPDEHGRWTGFTSWPDAS